MQNSLLNLAVIVPMAILCVFALLILALCLFGRKLPQNFYAVITLLALILDFGFVFGYSGGAIGFFDIMLVDNLAILATLIILGCSVFYIWLSLGAKSAHEYSVAEFFAIFLFMILGYEFMVSSENLMMIFVGLETSSLALYTLIAMHNRARSAEAALKYFVMGALGSAFYAFGAALFFLITGSFEISQIAMIAQNSGLSTSVALFGASAFMIASIGFKLSFIPFHTWIMDAYEGASSALSGFMSVAPKIAAFIVAIRLFEALQNIGVAWLNSVLYAIAVLTMSVANVMALVQHDVKRMLSYSAISHAGFGLCAIVIGTTEANLSLFVYWVLYAMANLGAFAVLWSAREKRDLHGVGSEIWARFEYPYEKFNGLIHTFPLRAIALAIFMLSLAGIPPFGLFWGKLYLLGSAIRGEFYGLAVIMAVNSAVALYYYLRLIVCMFLCEADFRSAKFRAALRQSSAPINFAVALCAVLCAIMPFLVDFISSSMGKVLL